MQQTKTLRFHTSPALALNLHKSARVLFLASLLFAVVLICTFAAVAHMSDAWAYPLGIGGWLAGALFVWIKHHFATWTHRA